MMIGASSEDLTVIGGEEAEPVTITRRINYDFFCLEELGLKSAGPPSLLCNAKVPLMGVFDTFVSEWSIETGDGEVGLSCCKPTNYLLCTAHRSPVKFL